MSEDELDFSETAIRGISLETVELESVLKSLPDSDLLKVVKELKNYYPIIKKVQSLNTSFHLDKDQSAREFFLDAFTKAKSSNMEQENFIHLFTNIMSFDPELVARMYKAITLVEAFNEK